MRGCGLLLGSFWGGGAEGRRGSPATWGKLTELDSRSAFEREMIIWTRGGFTRVGVWVWRRGVVGVDVGT